MRESTEGLFHSRGQRIAPDAETVDDLLRVTRTGSQRLFHAAFQLARKRRRKLTLVDKANVLPSMVLFRRYFDEIAEQYPDVQTERMYVDAAALHMVRRPQSFDVIVTENMFGDILSDLAAALIGVWACLQQISARTSLSSSPATARHRILPGRVLPTPWP